MTVARGAAVLFAALIVHSAIPAGPDRPLLPDVIGPTAAVAEDTDFARGVCDTSHLSGHGPVGGASNFTLACDGNDATYYTIDGACPSPGQWPSWQWGFRVDLGTARTVRSVRILFRPDVGPVYWRVRHRPDLGDGGTIIVDGNANTASRDTGRVVFPESATDRVWNLEMGSTASGGCLGIASVEIYDGPPPLPPVGNELVQRFCDSAHLSGHQPYGGIVANFARVCDRDDASYYTVDGACPPGGQWPAVQWSLSADLETPTDVGSARILFRPDTGPLHWKLIRRPSSGGAGTTVAEGDIGTTSQDTARVTFPAATDRVWELQMGTTAPGGCVGVAQYELYPPGDFGSDKAFTFGAYEDGATSKDPVNLATGVFTAQAEDLTLPGRVLGLSFTRWYNSADATTGPLGPAWTHTYNWTVTDSGTTVEVRRGDGRRDTFTRNPDGTYADPPDMFDTLTKNPDGTYALTLTSQVAYDFAPDGSLFRVREPAGNQITLAYADGDLTTITDTVGRQVLLRYDASHRLTELEDPLGRKVTYAYDASGRLAAVTDRLGNTVGEDPAAHRWQYAYDGTTQHLTTITDPDGRVRVRNAYDSQGRVFEQRDGLGALTTMAYGSGETTVTDPRGHQTTYTFDARMRVLTQADTVGAATYTITYTYDAVGDRTSVTDRNGNTTEFTYDARGNVLTKTDPAPTPGAPRPVTTFEYDARNDLTRIVDPLGFATEMAYDASSNVLLSVRRQVDASTWATTTYEYADPANPGQPTRITSPRGNAGGTPDPTFATSLAYDAQGDLVSRTDPDGARTTFAYDAAGRLLSFVDPDGNAPGGVPAEHTWTLAYDALDRETGRTDPLGGTLAYGYDGAGDRTSLADRNGNVTAYAYDANARLASVQQRPDPVGQPALVYTTAVARDASGNATRITQANGVATDYAYDALDRLTSVTTHPTPTAPLVTSYLLDGNGQPTSRTTGDGVTVSYLYDGLSRLVSVTGPGLAIAYAYDAAGRRTSMTDATGLTTYQYDGLGRVTQIAAPGGTLGYAYDPDGNRTALGYPGGDTVTYAYSPGGRMQTVTDWAGRTSTYSYAASGLVTALAFPNGLTTTYAYDRAQRLTNVSTRSATTTLFSQTYTLDPEGNRTRRDDAVVGVPAVMTEYGYDGLSRLLSAERRLTLTRTALPSESFTLDAATNLASRTGPAATYAYDGANRLLSDGTRAFAWNGADRLVQRGTDVFAYDPLGRLTSATVGVATVIYASDGDGLLRSRTQGAATTAYLWDTSAAPAPLLAAGSDRVVHGLGPLYRTLADGSYRVFIRDALGSVRAEAAGSGFVTGVFDFLSYGEPRGFPYQTPPLLGFAGELRDPATGLLYLRARWYDPGTGRFMSSDAVRGQIGLPASLNLFAYVWGNPGRFNDPSGHCPPCVVAFVLANPVTRGALIGAGAYIVSTVLSDAVTNRPLGSGLDPLDLAIATGAGALTGGASAGATIADQVVIGAYFSFAASTTSMFAHGRFDVGEATVALAVGGVGGGVAARLGAPGGSAGIVGASVGLLKEGALGTVSNLVQTAATGIVRGVQNLFQDQRAPGSGVSPAPSGK